MVAVPERFRDFVVHSLVPNLAGLAGTPVISGVFGPPGYGKSFQVRAICESLGVTIIVVNAADLESDRAGTPGKFVRAEYLRARDMAANGQPTALLVDDFDTTGGEWTQHTGTVNHLQVLAELMHLADDPQYLDGTESRPPIFLTGNDFSKLYPPLRRPGRMRSLYWMPSVDERMVMAKEILGHLASEQCLAAITTNFDHQPISFLVEVRSTAVAVRCDRLVKQMAESLADVCLRPDAFRTMLMLELGSGTMDETILRTAAELDAAKARQGESYVEGAGEKTW